MEHISRRDFVRNSLAASRAATTASASAAGTGRGRIVAISCSPRRGQGTATALGVCLQAAREVATLIAVSG